MRRGRLTVVYPPGKNRPMQSLIPKIESQLATLPVPIALELPDGRRVSTTSPSRVTLAFSEWSALAKLASRQIAGEGDRLPTNPARRLARRLG